MFTVTLILNGKPIPFDVKDESAVPSKHSNKKLIKLAIGIRAQGETSHSMIRQLIDEGKKNGIDGVYTKDNVTRRWKIVNNFLKTDPLETSFDHIIHLVEWE
jgi:hypothetical protein